jgi:hypothetical protein
VSYLKTTDTERNSRIGTKKEEEWKTDESEKQKQKQTKEIIQYDCLRMFLF